MCYNNKKKEIMSVSSKIYLDMGGKNKGQTDKLMNSISLFINDKIYEGYKENGVDVYEINKNMSLIRNKALLNNFTYLCIGSEKNGYLSSFYGDFKVFVEKELAHDVPDEGKIRVGGYPADIPHQNRSISIMPKGLNYDADNIKTIGRDIKEESDFAVISMSSDEVSMDFFNYLSAKLSEAFGVKAYFQPSDTTDELKVYSPDGKTQKYDSDGNKFDDSIKVNNNQKRNIGRKI